MTDRKGIGGPKTAEGKKKSSINSLRHGLYAETPQALEKVAKLVGKSYAQVLNEMRSYYWPRNPVHDALVRRIARCTWRMMLVEAMEDFQIGRSGLCPTLRTSREKLMRYERLTDIQLHRAIEALEKMQAAEKRNAQNELLSPPFPGVDHAQPERGFVPLSNPPTDTPAPI